MKLPNNYKYNAKEWQDELGLNMYDYGARNCDPALGRWMNIDPLAETSRRWSPYAYCYNNPMYFVDPDGMQATENEGVDIGYGRMRTAEQLNTAVDGSYFRPGDDPKPNDAKKVETAPATPFKNPDGTYNSEAYNCHSYAWCDSQGDPMDPENEFPVSVGVNKWDNNPLNNTEGYSPLDFNAENEVGDRLIYYAWDSDSKTVIATHSAIVTKIDGNCHVTEVESKWGQMAQYRHHPRDVPASYSAEQPTFVGGDGKTYDSRVYYRQN